MSLNCFTHSSGTYNPIFSSSHIPIFVFLSKIKILLTFCATRCHQTPDFRNMVDEGTRKTLAQIPLLKTKAGPRDGDLWVQRLKEEYQTLIKVGHFGRLNSSRLAKLSSIWVSEPMWAIIGISFANWRWLQPEVPASCRCGEVVPTVLRSNSWRNELGTHSPPVAGRITLISSRSRSLHAPPPTHTHMTVYRKTTFWPTWEGRNKICSS